MILNDFVQYFWYMEFIQYIDVSRCVDFKNVFVFFIFHESDSLDQNNLIMGRWSDLPYVHQMPQWECVVCLCSCTVCDDWVALRSYSACTKNEHKNWLLAEKESEVRTPQISFFIFHFCFCAQIKDNRKQKWKFKSD